MNSLSSQLNNLKLSQNALKIGPNQEQPTILFDKFTARNTSIDTIYSMSILAYDKLSSHLSNSLAQIQNRQELLSQNLKEVNRNTLTKQENNKLSKKLERFIIELAPFLLNSECQHIFEYLLRNFKVNVFEAETLCLSLLHLWNYEIYQKIISNINKRQMTGKLTFLNQMVSNEQINFSFIVKTLAFSHSILDRLISIILQGSLLQIKTSKDEMIRLSHEQVDQHFLKHPLKNFLLKIFLTIIKEKKTNHYKYIIDYCSSCLRIKYPASKSQQKFELMSSVLILLINLVFQNGISDQYLSRVVKKLLSKFVSNENQSSDKSLKQIFDFVMIIWQRKSHIIDTQVLEILEKSLQYLKYIKSFTSSKYMIFHHLWNLLCFEGAKCETLLENVNSTIKNQQFYKLHETKFMNSIFESYQRASLQSNISKEKLTWIRSFIAKNFKYELGVWINQNKAKNKQNYQNLSKNIFQQSQVNPKNSLILVEKIKRVLPQKKISDNKFSLGIERSKIQEQREEQSMGQDQSQKPKQKTKSKKLIEFLRTKGLQISENQNIDFSNAEVAKSLVQLFEYSYNKQTNQKDKLNFHQRVLVIQKYGITFNYTRKMLQKDLSNQQYAIPIKYLSAKDEIQFKATPQQIQSEFQFLQEVFSYILNKKSQLESILFKELLRLSLNRLLLLAQSKYKQAIQFVHKYYKKFITSCKSAFQYVQINSFILKISQRIFSLVGNNKGKYQNLIHSHCRLMAILVNSIDSHQFKQNNKGPVITHDIIQRTYRNIIRIFGSKELYLINIGIIELITRKQLNYRKLKYFIDDVMVQELIYETQTEKQSEISVNFYEHSISVGRCLIFSSYMLGQTDPEWINSIENVLTTGIAKNQISIFYGLIKDKLKRNIARKLFLFFKLTFQSKKFVAGFKNYLSSINDEQMRKLLHIYSQLYYILLSIDVNDAKIQAVIQRLLDDITNLFSLDLRLTLFKPILPNLKLYGYLTSQLTIHTEANFDELEGLINVVPDQLSIQWVQFTRQCLKRGHKMSSSTVETLFTNEHFLNNEQNFQLYCQLVCHLSQWDKDSIVPYINQSMNMILATCSTDSNQDYCLSILYKIIIQLKELVDPFVHDIYKFALENNSEFVQKFISDTVQYLTVPTLIETVKGLSKTTQHLYNFGVFFKYVCKNGVSHLLSKTLQYFASKTIHSAIQDEVDLSNLYQLQADIFLEMALKFNQNQLRKVLIDFVRWAQTKQNQEIGINFNMRKIVLSTIYSRLSVNLGSLFTPFYGYVFDSYLKDFQNISTSNAVKSKDGKRGRVESNFSDSITLIYLQKVLQSLSSLFLNDPQKQFLDSTKFDLLSERLSSLFTIQRFQYSQYITLASSLSSCLLNLCQYLTDDYQLKSLNLKILLLLRFKQSRSQEAIFTFMDKLIDQIQDRYLLFINDLVPFLIDNIHNRNEKVKGPIKSIISKFEEMSGSRIENYIK